MIIHSIKAENVLKYEILDLQDLPEKGLIAVSGLNESGKSSIGETLCFALFGRTFSLKQSDLSKIIRWGEPSCQVNLVFSIEDQQYSLYRYFDRDGNHSARLALVGQEDKPLARSAPDVERVRDELLGYGFDEFIESFYLAQREITSPHPHSMAIKTLAGVSALEHVAHGYQGEITHDQEMLDELNAELDALKQELEDLAFEEGELMRMEDEKSALEMELDKTRQLANELNTGVENYVDNEAGVASAKGKRSGAKFWRFLSLLLALVGGGVWALATQQPELAQTQQMLQLLQTQVPGWQPAYVNYIGIAGAVFAVLFLLFWMRAASAGGEAKRLLQESAQLGEVMTRVREVPEYEAVAEEGEESAPQSSSKFETQDYFLLHQQIATASAVSSEVRRYADIEGRWLAEQISLREENLRQMDEQVDEELARVRQVARLHEVEMGLLEKSADLNGRIGLRQKALELIQGATAHFSAKFNKDIRQLMSSTLPLFTQGRYEHLQVEPDLGVRVFSSDKRDFLDLEEISSGTQRQIMLALRLALSQKLMGRAVKGHQFAFLDEPFAFFDEERTRHALEALNELSEALSQIWIVAQSFPEGVDFALELHCSRDFDELEAG